MMRRAAFAILAFCGALPAGDIAVAQMALPSAKAPDPATLFKQQCATCHSTSLDEPPRQGPPLVGVIGREAGTRDGFRYSPGLAQAHFVWDESRLDAWLANPQAIVAGTNMAYRQAKPELRAAIIAYLKELN